MGSWSPLVSSIFFHRVCLQCTSITTQTIVFFLLVPTEHYGIENVLFIITFVGPMLGFSIYLFLERLHLFASWPRMIPISAGTTWDFISIRVRRWSIKDSLIPPSCYARKCLPGILLNHALWSWTSKNIHAWTRMMESKLKTQIFLK